MKRGVKKGIGVFFEYETQKIVQIKSKKVGIIYRLIQIIIVAYIVGWVIVYKKGYQEFDQIVSSVTTKVKGLEYVNLTNYSAIGARIYDVADYVIPPQENNAFFVMTNAVVTPRQKQGVCDEDTEVHNAKCSTNADCPPDGQPMPLGNGVATGLCVNSTKVAGVKTCQIRAWCPTEHDVLPRPGQPLLPAVKNFTILIKNSIEFPRFKRKKRNIDSYSGNGTALKTCHWQRDADSSTIHNKYCPVVLVDDILREISAPDSLLVAGGIIGIYIHWECNLDWSMVYCNPEYNFRRLDDEDAKIAKGWNFRYANYYVINGTEHRTLIKAYGLRFVIFVTGQAGKFNMIPLTMNLGSGLALLGLATILCDIIVLSLLNRKNQYREAKFQQLEDDDAYKIIEDDPTESSAQGVSP